MLKLLLSDVDGTLLQKGETRIPDHCEKRILSLVHSGVSFAAVSGRDVLSLRRLFAFLPEAYLIGCNGALCVKGDKTLYSRPIPPESALRLWQYTAKNRKSAVFCSDNALYVTGDGDFCRQVESSNPGVTFRAGSAPDIKGPVHKIAFFDENDTPGPEITPFDLRICYERHGWREYINRFASKGDAVSDLRMRLSLGRTSCAAVGNEPSDADMLQHAGYRFSFCDILARDTGARRISTLNQLFDDLDRIP